MDYTPAQAAQMLGCSAQTIRRYCAEFGVHLSPAANPSTGQARQLTAQDLYILGQVKEWTDAGATYEECHSRLDTLQVPTVVSVEPNDTIPPQVIVGLTEALTRLTSRIENTDALERRIARLEEENADLQQRVYSPLLWMLIGAVVMGMVGAGIALAVINLLG